MDEFEEGFTNFEMFNPEISKMNTALSGFDMSEISSALSGFDMSKINTTFPGAEELAFRLPENIFEEMNHLNLELIDDIPSVGEQIAEQMEPIVNGLTANYNKLSDLYELKVQELEESKKMAEKAKRDSRIMLGIAIFSAIVAAISIFV